MTIKEYIEPFIGYRVDFRFSAQHNINSNFHSLSISKSNISYNSGTIIIENVLTDAIILKGTFGANGPESLKIFPLSQIIISIRE